MFRLQMFAEAVAGTKIVYLYRVLSKQSSASASAISFATENGRTKSKDSDSVATKDGAVRTPGVAESEVTSTSLLAKGDPLVDALEKAMDNNELIEVWEVNLAEPAEEGENKFKAKYFQGYLTELEITSNAEDNVEVSLTFGLEGDGKDGDATVTTTQQEIAAYVFKDTQPTGV